MGGIFLFTGIEGTGKETLAYANFIKPLNKRTISFITIRDIFKGNFCKKSFVLPIMNIDTHPKKINFYIFVIQIIFYLLIIFPFIRDKEKFVRGLPLAYVFSFLKIKYKLFLPGIYSKEGKVYSKRDERFLKYVEEKGIINALRVFVPNEEIRDYILKNYDYIDIDVVYIPVDTGYFNIKEKFNNKIMVYSGTIPDKETEQDIIKTFYGFKKYIKNLKLVILSRKKIEGEDIHCFFLKKERLRDFLPRTHFGLIMEGRNENSKYLLTTKFSEYAASGIPVIVHNGIDALKKIVEKEKIGIVVNPDIIRKEYVSKIIKNYDEYSKNIRMFAEDILSYEAFKRRILNEDCNTPT